MSLGTLINDPKISPEIKQAALTRAGLTAVMSDPDLPQWLKQAVWKGTSPGDRREYYYERYARNPIRRAFEPTKYSPNLPGFKQLADAESAVGHFLAPEDLQSAGATVGGVAGSLGSPLLASAGAELGGTLGGMAMGRGAGESALRAAPGAAVNLLAPWAFKKLAGGAYEAGASRLAAKQMGESSSGLFKRVWDEHPELVKPRTPADLAVQYAKGNSPVVQAAGESLATFRERLRNEPAFWRVTVRVPVKTTDPITHTPQFQYTVLPLPEALDYQQAMYGRGYDIRGGPRGSIMAEPDRAVASGVRRQILESLKTQVPRGQGPKFAQQYEDLSHDYGVAQTMGDIFKSDTVNGPILNHEKILMNATHPNQMSHLASLVGPEEARQFISDIAPGRAFISKGESSNVSVGVPGVPVHIHAAKLGAPNVPPAFRPAFPQYSGPLTSQAVTNFIEGLNRPD